MHMSCVVKSARFLFFSASACLLLATTARAQLPPTNLVPRGANWKYHNLGQNLFTTQPTWKDRTYDDSAVNGWGGPAPAPIGDNNQGGNQLCTTVIDIGPANPR